MGQITHAFTGPQKATTLAMAASSYNVNCLTVRIPIVACEAPVSN